MTIITATDADLTDLQASNAYTILGCGGDLADWVTGYEDYLRGAGIATPTAWYSTTGAALNGLKQTELRDPLPNDLVVLLFPLTGLDIGKLAIFKLRMEDRWLDDTLASL